MHCTFLPSADCWRTILTTVGEANCGCWGVLGEGMTTVGVGVTGGVCT